jgi:tyrosinase
LTPFHRNTNGDFWTTNQVRDWKVFKYTYPEFANSDGSTRAIQSAINRLYGPGATATAGSSKRTAAPEPQTYNEGDFNEDSDVVDGTVTATAAATSVPAFGADAGAGASFSFGFGFGNDGSESSEAATTSASSDAVSTAPASNTPKASSVSSRIVDAGNGTSPAFPTSTATLKDNSTPLRANNGSSYQYICNIETPRYALNGSYSVFVFNGEPENPNPLTWSEDKNLIGPAGILAQPGMTEKNIIVTMGVPLTRTLVYEYTKGNIPDLTEDSVDHYLQQKLQWRVVGPQGQEIDSTTIPGFKAQVYGSTAAKAKSEDEIPQWSEFVPLVKATEGNDHSLESVSFTDAVA